MDLRLSKNKSTKGIKRSVSSFFLKDLPAWILLLPAVLAIYFVVIRPQFLGIYWSFFDMKGFSPQGFVGLANYRRVLADPMFIKTFWNTCLYVIYSIVIGYFIPIILAVMLNEMVHIRNTFRVLIYFPAIIPGVAASVLWTLLYYPDQGGLLNMILMAFGKDPYVWLQDPNNTILFICISMTWSGMGGTVIYYFAALQGVSRELFEAALLDGAGFFRRLTTVTIPHIAPIALLFFIKQIIGIFSVCEQPLQMTGGGPNGASLSLGLMSYQHGFVAGRPQLSLAIGVIMFLILLVFTCFYFVADKKLSE